MPERFIEINPDPEYENLIVGYPGISPLFLKCCIRLYGREKKPTEFTRIRLKICSANFIYIPTHEPISHDKDPLLFPLYHEVPLHPPDGSIIVQPQEFVDIPFELPLSCFNGFDNGSTTNSNDLSNSSSNNHNTTHSSSSFSIFSSVVTRYATGSSHNGSISTRAHNNDNNESNTGSSTGSNNNRASLDNIITGIGGINSSTGSIGHVNASICSSNSAPSTASSPIASTTQPSEVNVALHYPNYQGKKWHHGPFRFLCITAECKIRGRWPFSSTESISRNIEIQPLNQAVLSILAPYFFPKLRLVSKKKDPGFTWQSKNEQANWDIKLSRTALLPGMSFIFSWQITPFNPFRIKSIQLRIIERVDVGSDIQFQNFLITEDIDDEQLDIFKFELAEESHGKWWQMQQQELTVPLNLKSCLGTPASTGSWGRDFNSPSLKVIHYCEIQISFKNGDPIVKQFPVGFVMMSQDKVCEILENDVVWSKVGCQKVLAEDTTVNMNVVTDCSVTSPSHDQIVEEPYDLLSGDSPVTDFELPEYTMIAPPGSSHPSIVHRLDPSSHQIININYDPSSTSNELRGEQRTDNSQLLIHYDENDKNEDDEDENEILDAVVVDDSGNISFENEISPEYDGPVDIIIFNEKSQLMTKVFGRGGQEENPTQAFPPSLISTDYYVQAVEDKGRKENERED